MNKMTSCYITSPVAKRMTVSLCEVPVQVYPLNGHNMFRKFTEWDRIAMPLHFYFLWLFLFLHANADIAP